MTDQDAASRRGFSKPGRNAPDLRLVLGVLLVVGSVAGVWGIVAAADRRVTVYAAASALTPGERIDAGDLVQRSVALDGSDRLYLAAGRIPSGGLVVTQPVAKGELLPTSSVGSTSGVRSTSLVLQLATRVSGAVVPGATIDIWAAADPDATVTMTPQGAGNGAAGTGTAGDGVPSGAGPATSLDATAPTVIVSGATVVKVLDDSGGFSVASSGSSVEVLVPRSRVARLLQAIAQKAALAVVPAGIPIAESWAAGGGS
jgi:flagella basal body P-ring formation protein FlgA